MKTSPLISPLPSPINRLPNHIAPNHAPSPTYISAISRLRDSTTTSQTLQNRPPPAKSPQTRTHTQVHDRNSSIHPPLARPRTSRPSPWRRSISTRRPRRRARPALQACFAARSSDHLRGADFHRHELGVVPATVLGRGAEKAHWPRAATERG
jgi:hypothetical protein